MKRREFLKTSLVASAAAATTTVTHAAEAKLNGVEREFLVVHGADCITGHALDNGRELWRFAKLNGPTETNPKPHDPTFRFVASPGIVAGLIVVPTAKGGPTVGLKVSDALSGDCSDKPEVVAWVHPRTPDVSTPLIADGLVYLLHNDGKLQCLDAATCFFYLIRGDVIR